MTPLFLASAESSLYPVVLFAFSNLRQSWAGEWMGLHNVLKACQDFLMDDGVGWEDSEAQTLMKCAFSLAHAIESQVNPVNDPAYHNRLHTGDALCGLTVLLKAMMQQEREIPAEWVAGLLLAVTAHDYQHPGGANTSPQELEINTVKALNTFLTLHPISSVWRERIHHIIIRSDPALVAANHDSVAGRSFAWDLDWACVLMNEADILASATDLYGPQLGEKLAIEWHLKGVPSHAVIGTPQGRLIFLKSLRFSSPGSLSLQLPQNTAQQVAALLELEKSV